MKSEIQIKKVQEARPMFTLHLRPMPYATTPPEFNHFSVLRTRQPMAVISITRVTPIYTWAWQVPDDELCGICRISFDGTCPNCLLPGDSCPLTIGECHHAFHLHCIEKWLQQGSSRGLCPMCRQPFNVDIAEEVNQGVVITDYHHHHNEREAEVEN